MILFLTASTRAISVELGNIEVHSHLNQPFHAQIPIEAADVRGVGSIRVGLAAPREFARLALYRPPWMGSLHFDLELGQDRNGRIVITSQEMQREPYAEFVLEVKWNKGRLLRKYVVIVDLPIDPAKIGKGLPPSSGRGTGGSKARKAMARYGPVAPGESLMSIASKVRLNSSTSVRRMMNALFENNPGAFIKHDINRIKAGVVLSVPEIEGEGAVITPRPPVTKFPTKLPDTGVAQGIGMQVKTDTVKEQPETADAGDVIVNTPSARSDDKLRIVSPRVPGIREPSSPAARPSKRDDGGLLRYMAENAELRRRTAEIEDSLNHMESQLETMRQLLAALTDFHQHNALRPSTPKPEMQSSGQTDTPRPPALSPVMPLELAGAPIPNPVTQPVDTTGRKKKTWWLAAASALLGGLLILATIIGLLKWSATPPLPAKT